MPVKNPESNDPGQGGQGNRPRRLSLSAVPAEFRQLIPLAERWGINDDVERGDALDKATVDDLQYIVDQVEGFHRALDNWLAGAESYAPILSDEYIAFTCLRLACDEARWRLQNRKAKYER